VASRSSRVGPIKSFRLKPVSVFEVGFGLVASRRVDRSSARLLRSAFRHAPRPAGCRLDNRTGSLRGEFVLVKQTAESIAPTDTPIRVSRSDGRCFGELLEAAETLATTQSLAHVQRFIAPTSRG
jgi:hypothetical protein